MPRNQPGVQIYSLYGDPAYPQLQYLVGSTRNPAPKLNWSAMEYCFYSNQTAT
jgi:hypothetical protein